MTRSWGRHWQASITPAFISPVVAKCKACCSADQLLLIEALNTLEIWEPNLNALVRGQGAEFTITAGQVNAIDDFLVNLSAAASPEPQQVIADERSKLPLPESFVGLTMEEAREIVVDYAT